MTEQKTLEGLVLPPTRDGRTPSGMKTSIGGAGNRISRTHELGERVVLVIEAKVKSSGHEETEKDGVLYVESMKTLDLFELPEAPGRRLLAALRQSYRTAEGQPPLTNGDETAGEGIEVAVDAAGVAITPAELAALREDPASALEDERFDHVVLVFADGSRGLWPDDWAGTGQSRAPIGGTMRRPGSRTPGDVDQVVELLDAKTGETLDKWTDEREQERLLALEQSAEADEERAEALERFEFLRDRMAEGPLEHEEAFEYETLLERFTDEARADRETMEELGIGEPAEANEDLVQPGEPDPDGPFERPDEELELEVELETCAICGRPEADELHDGPADTEGLHLFEPHELEDEHAPQGDDYLFVDRDVADLKADLRNVTDRDAVLRALRAEEDGRGRGLKPRKGALEALEKRAGELFVAEDEGAPEPGGDDLEVPENADDFDPED